MSKEALFESVWKDTVVTDDSLVQCISDIRKSIGDKERKVLVVQPRRGYILYPDKESISTDNKAQPDNAVNITHSEVIADAKNEGIFGIKKWSLRHALIPITLLIFAIIYPNLHLGSKQAAEDADTRMPTLAIDASSRRQKASVDESLLHFDKSLSRILSRYDIVRLSKEPSTADYVLTLEAAKTDEGWAIHGELFDNDTAEIFFAEQWDLLSESEAEATAGSVAASISSAGGGRYR